MALATFATATIRPTTFKAVHITAPPASPPDRDRPRVSSQRPNGSDKIDGPVVDQNQPNH